MTMSLNKFMKNDFNHINNLDTSLLQNYWENHISSKEYIYKLSDGKALYLDVTINDFYHASGLSKLNLLSKDIKGKKAWDSLKASPKNFKNIDFKRNGIVLRRISSLNKYGSILMNPDKVVRFDYLKHKSNGILENLNNVDYLFMKRSQGRTYTVAVAKSQNNNYNPISYMVDQDNHADYWNDPEVNIDKNCYLKRGYSRIFVNKMLDRKTYPYLTYLSNKGCDLLFDISKKHGIILTPSNVTKELKSYEKKKSQGKSLLEKHHVLANKLLSLETEINKSQLDYYKSKNRQSSIEKTPIRTPDLTR